MQVFLKSARFPLGGHGNPLQYSCLANSMTEEPSGLQSMESQTVRHDWSDWACMHARKERMGLPRWLRGKESTCQWRRHRRHRFDPWVGKVPWRRKWQPISVFLPGISHGQRSLVGYSPWGHRVGHCWVTKHTCKHVLKRRLKETCLCFSLTPTSCRFHTAKQFPICWPYPPWAPWFTFLCWAKVVTLCFHLLSLSFQRCDLFFHCTHFKDLKCFSFLWSCFSENVYFEM